MSSPNSSTERVQQALQDLGLSYQVQQLPQSTRTAEAAAEAVGCRLGQIVKSLLFEDLSAHQPILILTSGENQVDEELVSTSLGQQIQLASPDFVRRKTGFAIGGVAPVGLREDIPTYIDQDLLSFPAVWAAAGSPRAVFQIHPQELVRATGGKVIQVS